MINTNEKEEESLMSNGHRFICSENRIHEWVKAIACGCARVVRANVTNNAERSRERKREREATAN